MATERLTEKLPKMNAVESSCRYNCKILMQTFYHYNVHPIWHKAYCSYDRWTFRKWHKLFCTNKHKFCEVNCDNDTAWIKSPTRNQYHFRVENLPENSTLWILHNMVKSRDKLISFIFYLHLCSMHKTLTKWSAWIEIRF